MRGVLYRIPKPVLFAALGALGCLLGWVPGEPLLTVLRKPGNRGGVAASPASPVLVFKTQTPAPPPFVPELAGRLERESAKTGDVQISLMWNNFNDIDLHCVDPQSERIFFGHKKSASGGELDVDMNAGGPLSREPVENIYWPSNGAPDGTYIVEVNHYAIHDSVNATPYYIGIKVSGQTLEFRGTISYPQTQRVHTFTLDVRKQREEQKRIRQEYKAQLRQMAQALREQPPGIGVSWLSTFVLGVWTALLASGLAVLIVVGQNLLLRRHWLSLREAGTVIGGGLLAGMLSGAVSQHLFAFIAQGLAEGSWMVQSGQIFGWMLLGFLLGGGLSFFIPNLPRLRAALAGGLGGLLGAAAFLSVLALCGDMSGRLAGATALGGAIGLAVALVERLAREAALVVHWHANEQTIINLGDRPVILGSSSEAHLYLPKEKGFPSVAALVTFRGGKVELENKLTGTRHSLANGNKLQIGNLTVEVRTAG
jgi:hypothetical protein